LSRSSTQQVDSAAGQGHQRLLVLGFFGSVVLVVASSGGDKGGIVGNGVSSGSLQRDRGRLVGGGVLIGTGGLLALTGVLLFSLAVVSATRQWVSQLEQPPSELAKLKWRQARTATVAGANAWRNGPAAEVSS